MYSFLTQISLFLLSLFIFDFEFRFWKSNLAYKYLFLWNLFLYFLGFIYSFELVQSFWEYFLCFIWLSNPSSSKLIFHLEWCIWTDGDQLQQTRIQSKIICFISFLQKEEEVFSLIMLVFPNKFHQSAKFNEI